MRLCVYCLCLCLCLSVSLCVSEMWVRASVFVSVFMSVCVDVSVRVFVSCVVYLCVCLSGVTGCLSVSGCVVFVVRVDALCGSVARNNYCTLITIASFPAHTTSHHDNGVVHSLLMLS